MTEEIDYLEHEHDLDLARNKMYCPECGSPNVNVQVVQVTQLVPKRRGVIWWVCVGWWWLPFKWLYLTIPALIVKIFAPKRQILVQTTHSVCVCQDCGHHWDI